MSRTEYRTTLPQRLLTIGWQALALVLATAPAVSQSQPRQTRNVSLVAHVELKSHAVDVDQDPGREFAYAALSDETGFAVVSLIDGSLLSTWTPTGSAVVHDLTHLVSNGKNIVATVTADALYLVDVSDPATPKPLASTPLESDVTAGRVFGYRHSSGRSLLAIATGQSIVLYDADSTDEPLQVVAQLETPEQLERRTSGFDFVLLQYDLASGQDRLYGGGAGGYHVFDISDPAAPQRLVSVNPATIERGQVVAPTPDGRYIVTTADYAWSPVRIFDLQPLFDGTTNVLQTSESAWTSNWKGLARAIEVRWPLVFTASSGDGLQIFNMRDAAAPYTVGYFMTSENSDAQSGAFDVDVRNEDGSIVVADRTSGVWVVRLDEMQSWNGHGYGLPNTSTAQDWKSGPDTVGAE